MQLFDDPRYAILRKKYDPKVHLGFGILFPAIFLNFIFNSNEVKVASYVLQTLAFAFLFWNGITFRRELKQLDVLRNGE